ncbi:MAG: hypothetical protein JW724_01480 [Candidatus Altiarchaeota archaeon]|nr:hypothetical protein [Candidatus Altiarchaeota archaeon]
MKPSKNKDGYAFIPDKEYIKKTYKMSAKMKLAWLKEANEFIYTAKPMEKK